MTLLEYYYPQFTDEKTTVQKGKLGDGDRG